jgi:hypothetical protein
MTSPVAIKHGLKNYLSKTTFHFGMLYVVPTRDQSGNDWVYTNMFLNQLSLSYYSIFLLR